MSRRRKARRKPRMVLAATRREWLEALWVLYRLRGLRGE